MNIKPKEKKEDGNGNENKYISLDPLVFRVLIDCLLWRKID